MLKKLLISVVALIVMLTSVVSAVEIGDDLYLYGRDNKKLASVLNMTEGEVKDYEFFSEGLKDIADICSRLALVEALYEEEKPILIFDDPFVNLDDDKLEKAKQLLQVVAKEYQVVYFTCHSSRI